MENNKQTNICYETQLRDRGSISKVCLCDLGSGEGGAPVKSF